MLVAPQPDHMLVVLEKSFTTSNFLTINLCAEFGVLIFDSELGSDMNPGLLGSEYSSSRRNEESVIRHRQVW